MNLNSYSCRRLYVLSGVHGCGIGSHRSVCTLSGDTPSGGWFTCVCSHGLFLAHAWQFSRSDLTQLFVFELGPIGTLSTVGATLGIPLVRRRPRRAVPQFSVVSHHVVSHWVVQGFRSYHVLVYCERVASFDSSTRSHLVRLVCAHGGFDPLLPCNASRAWPREALLQYLFSGM